MNHTVKSYVLYKSHKSGNSDSVNIYSLINGNSSYKSMHYRSFPRNSWDLRDEFWKKNNGPVCEDGSLPHTIK